MSNTHKLSLPYLLPSQAQKHVTHNEALRRLDAIVQAGAISRTLSDPPASPSDGDQYIVGASPTGAWAGEAMKFAAFQDGAWAFIAPASGWTAYVADEDTLIVWTGSAWRLATGGTDRPFGHVGVNATPDDTNRLAVASPASLFSHEGDDHQLKINKAAESDTASVLFQTGYSGRAELGCAGDDDWQLKVSADGSAWLPAVRVDGRQVL